MSDIISKYFKVADTRDIDKVKFERKGDKKKIDELSKPNIIETMYAKKDGNYIQINAKFISNISKLTQGLSFKTVLNLNKEKEIAEIDGKLISAIRDKNYKDDILGFIAIDKETVQVISEYKFKLDDTRFYRETEDIVSRKEIGMFQGTNFEYIDLRGVNVEEVKNITLWFQKCKTKAVFMQGLNFKSLERAEFCFERCDIQSLDLSKTKFSNKVLYSEGMFLGAKILNLNLSNVLQYEEMDYTSLFEGATIGRLDLTNCKGLSKIQELSYTFTDSVIGILIVNTPIRYRHDERERSFLNCKVREIETTCLDEKNIRIIYKYFNK